MLFISNLFYTLVYLPTFKNAIIYLQLLHKIFSKIKMNCFSNSCISIGIKSLWKNILKLSSAMNYTSFLYISMKLSTLVIE